MCFTFTVHTALNIRIQFSNKIFATTLVFVLRIDLKVLSSTDIIAARHWQTYSDLLFTENQCCGENFVRALNF